MGSIDASHAKIFNEDAEVSTDLRQNAIGHRKVQSQKRRKGAHSYPPQGASGRWSLTVVLPVSCATPLDAC
jgi:hypothetical protein